nr:hypothetical protein [Tanacetum cinerariifolium]
MSTQQDIYAAGSENPPPMLNKDNYVTRSSRLFCYAKSKPNENLIYNYSMHGPYVKRMIPELGDLDRDVPIAETFHEHTIEELSDKEVKQMKANDQVMTSNNVYFIASFTPEMAHKEEKLTTRKIVTNDQANYYSRITNITVNGKNAYELKGKLLDDLPKNAFSGTNGGDAVEHIEYFLKFVDPIDLPNVNQDKLRVVVFPISLVGDAWRWFDEIKRSITSWVDLTRNFLRKYYPPSSTGEINNLIIKWDPTNPKFKNWLASKFVNYKTMDIFTKGALWDYWKLGSDEINPTNDETCDIEETKHDDEHKIGEIFRLETNLFDYETPLYEEFKEFHYLLKINPDLLTKDIKGFKTYEEFKDDWIYE